MIRKIPPYVLQTVLTLLVFIVFFSMERWLFERVLYAGKEEPLSSFPYFQGLRFDLMVSAYLVLPVFALHSFLFLSGSKSNVLFRISFLYLACISVFAVLVACADIPYFRFFSSRITTGVFLWMDDARQSLRFLFSEPKFYPFMAAFIFLAFIFYIILKKIWRRPDSVSGIPKTRMRFLVFFVTGALYFYALRGAQLMRPAGIRDAFAGNNTFENQLALNPVMTFFDSFMDFRFKIMEDSAALNHVRQALGIQHSEQSFPLARRQEQPSSKIKKNIVLILMESMNMERMRSRIGSGKMLTPFLDSLSNHSLFFDNFYSCGIHTCNGVYGSLFGMPSVFSRHPMSNAQSDVLQFYAMPQVLKEQGYVNLVFCTHQETFDNMGSFLPRNGIDRLFHAGDYPPEARENVWGVNDEFLFHFALTRLDSLALKQQSFFATLLTISTHPPQQCPVKTRFKPSAGEVMDQVYEYADFALDDFFRNCKLRSWYKETIFVLVGDHGINSASPYDAPLSLNHVPLLIIPNDSLYAAETYSSPGMQTDIFPSVMHLAGISFINNTFGINLFAQHRPFAFFTQDKRLCATDSRFYFVADKSGNEILYDLSGSSGNNVLANHPGIAAAMKSYAFSFIQSAQYLIDHKLTGKPGPSAR